MIVLFFVSSACWVQGWTQARLWWLLWDQATLRECPSCLGPPPMNKLRHC
jgi:hypothetical protein